MLLHLPRSVEGLWMLAGQCTVHLLWRDEAQPLITEGVVEMVL